MDTRVAEIRTVREAVPARVAGMATDGETRLVAGGRLKQFRCAALPLRESGGSVLVGEEGPFSAGDEVLHAWF